MNAFSMFCTVWWPCDALTTPECACTGMVLLYFQPQGLVQYVPSVSNACLQPFQILEVSMCREVCKFVEVLLSFEVSLQRMSSSGGRITDLS